MLGVLAGCANSDTVVRSRFEGNLICGMTRAQIYDLATRLPIDSFICRPVPFDPPSAFTAFRCTAQQGTRAYELRFDRAGGLRGYKRGDLSFPTNVVNVEERELCQ